MLLLFAVPAYASEVSVDVEGDDATVQAIKLQLDAIKACFAEGNEAIDLEYKVGPEVSESAPAQAACIDAAVKELALPEGATATLKIKRAPEAEAPAKVADVDATLAEPQPSEQPAGDPATAGTAATAQQTSPPEQPKPIETPAVAATTEAPKAEEEAKPWSVTGNLTQSLGQGVFSGPKFASYGYTVAFGGSYTVDKKYLSIGLRWGFDQELTSSFQSGGTFERELLVQDLSISASAPELYKDDLYTGIKLTGGVGFGFPISKTSRAQELVIAPRINIGLSRAFENVGPGTLTFSWASGFKFNISPGVRSLDPNEAPSSVNICDLRNKTEKAECITNMANPRYAFSNGLTASYAFLEKFNVSYTFSISNGFSTNLSTSELPNERLRADVEFDPNTGHSPNAVPGVRPQGDNTVSTLEFSYAVLDNLSIALGLSTGQDPFTNSNGNQYGLRNPFWDVTSGPNNLSSFYLDIGGSY